MNAISYCTSLERQGWYLRRPNVDMPEKTESACFEISLYSNGIHSDSIPYLSPAVTGEGVVPKTLMWTGQWLLVMVVITMRCNSSYEAQERRSKPHFAKLLSDNEVRNNQFTVKKEFRFQRARDCGK